MTEAALQQRITKYARRHGVFARKIVAVNYRGFPDLFMAYGGDSWFIELKNPFKTGKLSRLQEVCIAEMRAAGLQVYVIDDYDVAISVIEDHIKNVDKIKSHS